MKILTAGWAISVTVGLLIALGILWIARPTRAERLRCNRWFREGATAVARVGGFSPTGRNWVERIKHLSGEFGPSQLELFPRWFMALGCGVASVAAALGCVRDFRNEFLTDVAWLEATSTIVFLSLFVLGVYWLWRRYIFEGGSVRRIWGKSHELWREDLTGLKDIICTSGPVNWMKLEWSGHSRRVQLYDSLRKALDAGIRPANDKTRTKGDRSEQEVI